MLKIHRSMLYKAPKKILPYQLKINVFCNFCEAIKIDQL